MGCTSTCIMISIHRVPHESRWYCWCAKIGGLRIMVLCPWWISVEYIDLHCGYDIQMGPFCPSASCTGWVRCFPYLQQKLVPNIWRNQCQIYGCLQPYMVANSHICGTDLTICIYIYMVIALLVWLMYRHDSTFICRLYTILPVKVSFWDLFPAAKHLAVIAAYMVMCPGAYVARKNCVNTMTPGKNGNSFETVM